jgi:hypothetical protein
MIADAARSEKKQEEETDENGLPKNKGGKTVHRSLKTKEDIKNYVKGII